MLPPLNNFEFREKRGNLWWRQQRHSISLGPSLVPLLTNLLMYSFYLSLSSSFYSLQPHPLYICPSFIHSLSHLFTHSFSFLNLLYISYPVSISHSFTFSFSYSLPPFLTGFSIRCITIRISEPKLTAFPLKTCSVAPFSVKLLKSPLKTRKFRTKLD